MRTARPELPSKLILLAETQFPKLLTFFLTRDLQYCNTLMTTRVFQARAEGRLEVVDRTTMYSTTQLVTRVQESPCFILSPMESFHVPTCHRYAGHPQEAGTMLPFGPWIKNGNPVIAR